MLNMKLANGQNAIEDSGYFPDFDEMAMASPLSISHRVIALQVEWLQACYPVACKLVGKDRFSALILAFKAKYSQECHSPDDLIREFADYVELSTGTDTSSNFKAMVRLECQIYQIPKPSQSFGRLAFYLHRRFSKNRAYSLELGEHVFLLRSCNNEVECWLSLQQTYRNLSKQSVAGIHSDYWMIHKSAEGLVITPLDRQQFYFYNQLKNGVSMRSLTRKTTDPVTGRWIIRLLKQGDLRLVESPA